MSAVERVVRFVERRNPFFLSHHPRCERYAHHTFELHGAQFCMGCFIVYPVGALSLALLSLARLLAPGLFGLSTLGFYALGVALAAPLVVTKAVSGTRWSPPVRMATKGLLAVGAAMFFFPLLFRSADRLQSGALIAASLVAYLGYKGATALDECEGCPEQGEFPNCTGMQMQPEDMAGDDDWIQPVDGGDGGD